MSADVLLCAAKRQRQETVKLLRACRCAYPLRTFRNGSGHADDCPSHALWREMHAKEAVLRDRIRTLSSLSTEDT